MQAFKRIKGLFLIHLLVAHKFLNFQCSVEGRRGDKTGFDQERTEQNVGSLVHHVVVDWLQFIA